MINGTFKSELNNLIKTEEKLQKFEIIVVTNNCGSI